MNDFSQKQLLMNYLLGICTSREREKVERWLDEAADNVDLLQQVANELAKKAAYPKPAKADVKKELFHRIDPSIIHVKNSKKNRDRIFAEKSKFVAYKRNTMALKLAALFLIVCVAGIMAVVLDREISFQTEQEMLLSQRTLPNGQTATLRFGDGSEIQLNGGSTLRYPDTFGSDSREVYLDGEAFFRIARDEERPFIIHAGNTITEVLGTSFNIKAYPDEHEIQVAVASGKVKVMHTTSDDFLTETVQDYSEPIFLEENQWVAYRSIDGVLKQGEGNIRETIAWKDRVLIFSNKTFKEVAKMLERWYGIKVTIENSSLNDYILEGEHQDVSLEEVLKSIRFVMDFEYEINEQEARIY